MSEPVRAFTLSLSAGEVFARWRDDPAFVDGFVAQLAEIPFAAMFWETPAVRRATADTQPFAFVAIDAPALARCAPEPDVFAGSLADAPPGPVATFPNLGGDAVLVVPRPAATPYPHLAAFVRAAPLADQRALWRAVGIAVAARLAARPEPVWVSTAGMGVTWLHVRLDERPKYYRHGPYRRQLVPSVG